MKKLLGLIKRHIKETVIIASLLLAGFLSLIFVNLFARSGTTVKVSLYDEPYAEYSLFVDAEYRIGEGNILTVSGAEAYMSYAACPNGVCLSMGKISHIGENISCRPNGVFVWIE